MPRCCTIHLFSYSYLLSPWIWRYCQSSSSPGEKNDQLYIHILHCTTLILETWIKTWMSRYLVSGALGARPEPLVLAPIDTVSLTSLTTRAEVSHRRCFQRRRYSYSKKPFLSLVSRGLPIKLVFQLSNVNVVFFFLKKKTLFGCIFFSQSTTISRDRISDSVTTSVQSRKNFFVLNDRPLCCYNSLCHQRRRRVYPRDVTQAWLDGVVR